MSRSTTLGNVDARIVVSTLVEAYTTVMSSTALSISVMPSRTSRLSSITATVIIENGPMGSTRAWESLIHGSRSHLVDSWGRMSCFAVQTVGPMGARRESPQTPEVHNPFRTDQ